MSLFSYAPMLSGRVGACSVDRASTRNPIESALHPKKAESKSLGHKGAELHTGRVSSIYGPSVRLHGGLPKKLEPPEVESTMRAAERAQSGPADCARRQDTPPRRVKCRPVI